MAQIENKLFTFNSQYKSISTVSKCANTAQMIIQKIALEMPNFNQFDPICETQSVSLPSTSINGITGWSGTLSLPFSIFIDLEFVMKFFPLLLSYLYFCLLRMNRWDKGGNRQKVVKSLRLSTRPMPLQPYWLRTKITPCSNSNGVHEAESLKCDCMDLQV